MTCAMLDALKALEDSAWDRYLFLREPFAGRMTAEQKDALAGAAHACGREAAQAAKSGGITDIEAAVVRYGGSIERRAGEEAAVFALFYPPAHIVLYPDTYAAAERYAKERGLDALLPGLDIAGAALAHEFFHMYEELHPRLYTNRRVLTLWSWHRFKRDVRVGVLSEIAAAAFVRSFFGWDFHPLILEALMLYSLDEQKGAALYRKLMAMA